MRNRRLLWPAICLLAASAAPVFGQDRDGERVVGTAAAITGSKENPAAVERGGKLFQAKCGGCHGNSAKGTKKAPDLIRSLLVLDDEKGILISPVIRQGRVDKGMPKLNLTEPEISDVVAWLHVQTYAADHRNTYEVQNVVTGDAKKGEAYFNGAGGCNKCHSPTGDLAGIANRYEPYALQGHWLQPRGRGAAGGGRGGRGGAGRGGNAPAVNRSAITVKVTLANGQTVSGVLDRIDDFNVSLRDSEGAFHSFTREGAAAPKVELTDPLKAHTDLLPKYTDEDIHNLTTYLVTLK